MDNLFYQEEINLTSKTIFLNEDASKHIIQVLRMTKGETVRLTDGKGLHVQGEIIDDNRKKTEVRILQSHQTEPPATKISIAISPVKNSTRFEWFLEKASEIGVTEIIPIICERTEKTKLKTDRLNGILISAMMQSGQFWKPELKEPLKFSQFIHTDFNGQRFIAHCEKDQERNSLLSSVNSGSSKQILIGPEGDFTSSEINLALENNFRAVSLGNTRLRTETAGVVAAVIFVGK